MLISLDNMIYNLDQLEYIHLKEDTITFSFVGTKKTTGQYKNKDEAEEVFTDIIATLTDKDLLINLNGE